MQRIQDMFINMEEVAEDAYKNTELLLSQYTKRSEERRVGKECRL